MEKGFSKSWDTFPSQQSKGPNLSSYSLPVDSSAHRDNEQAVISEPSFEQSRPFFIALGSWVAANPIEVPAIVPLPNLIQATNEIFPVLVNEKRTGGRKMSKNK